MATVEFFGEQFTLVGEVSEFALMEFADAAADGQDGDTMQGMASMYRLVRECVVAEDWGRFRALARAKKAKSAHLVPVLDAAFKQVAERPTGRSSDSSDGAVSIEPKSVSSVDASDLETLLAGRPDKQLAVVRTRAG